MPRRRSWQRAIVRDLFVGVEAARVYTLQMMAVAITPMMAPVLGGYLLLFFGWRSIFWTQACVAALVFVSMHVGLARNAQARAGRNAASDGATLRGYVALLFDKRFRGATRSGNGFGAGALFTYIATSSHVYIDVYGMRPEMFGWLFGFASLGVMAASQIASYLHHRFGVAQVLSASFIIKEGLALLVLGLWLVDGGIMGFRRFRCSSISR